MSVTVNVVGQTAVSVSVASQSAASVSVAASTGASVIASGGIGPAGFLTAPGTAAIAFGTFQLTPGDGITVSTANGQFLISSYPSTTLSTFAPVQSVAGRTGTIVLQASDVTAGTFAIGQIPTIGYTALSGLPTAFTPASHTHDASAITSGTLSIARVPTISYTALANVPATFAPQAHTHSTADIAGFTSSFAAGNHTHDAAAVTSGVLDIARVPVIGYTALSGVPASFSPSAHTHDAAAIASGVLEAARIPTVSYTSLSNVPLNFPTNTTLVSGLNSSYSGINHGHNYVTSLNNLTGALTLAAGSNVTLTANGSTLTIDSKAGIDGDFVIDGVDYVGEIIYSGTITITQQPSNQTAVNNAASFSVAANVSPAGNLAYQWQRSDNNGSTWLTAVGATATSVSLSGLTVASDNNDRYRVVVSSSGAASVTSNAATLTVSSPGGDGTAASPWEIDGNFGSRTFTAPAAGTLYVQYAIYRPPGDTSPYGFNAIKSGGVLFIEILAYGNSLGGTVNSYTQQGRTLSAGEEFFVQELGRVNIGSIILWVA